MLTKAETRAQDLLTSHRQALARLTAALLEQETVSGDQVRALAWADMTTRVNYLLLLNVLVDSAPSIPQGAKAMRHPRILIASMSLAAAAAIGGGVTAAAATTSHGSSGPAASQHGAARRPSAPRC